MTTANGFDVSEARKAGLEKARAVLAANRDAATAKMSASLRLEERARIARERAEKLQSQLERRRQQEAKRAERALKEDAYAHGIGGCHKRITALDERIRRMEEALGMDGAKS